MRSIFYFAGLLDGPIPGVLRDDAPDRLGPVTWLLLALHPEGEQLRRAMRVVELRETLEAEAEAAMCGDLQAVCNAQRKARELAGLMPDCDQRMAKGPA